MSHSCGCNNSCNSCGCNNLFAGNDNYIWIIILIFAFFCLRNNNDCGCDNSCGCNSFGFGNIFGGSGNSYIWIIVLFFIFFCFNNNNCNDSCYC